MTKSEVIKEFFKKSVLPVAVAALLYCIFKSACTKDGVTDYVWLFILCGLPFGIPRMFAWIVPGGSLGTALPLFLLNFIIGGVIGGFVLVWRLLVAVWYIFLTIYRINAECILLSLMDEQSLIVVGQSDYGITTPAEHSAISLQWITSMFLSVFHCLDALAHAKVIHDWVEEVRKAYFTTADKCFGTNINYDENCGK